MNEETRKDEPGITVTIGPVECRRLTDEEMRRVHWLSNDPRRNRFVLTPDGGLKRRPPPLIVRIHDAALAVIIILALLVIVYGVLWIGWVFYISLGGGR